MSFLLVFSLFITVFITNCHVARGVHQEEIDALANYLQGHFNETMGLIYETESLGEHYLIGKFPWLENIPNDHIFWLFDDNLLATYALDPYNQTMVHEIRETLNNYGYNETLNRPFFWETLFGYDIPDDQRIGEDYAVEYVEYDYAILVNRNNGTETLSWWNYTDSLVMKSLDLLWEGKKDEAKEQFRKAYGFFDGVGVYDRRANETGYYITFKLALLVYAGKILDLDISPSVENRLWAMQNQTSGGIAALMNFDGTPRGSCNSEAACLTLIAYNDDLIAKLREKAGISPIPPPIAFFTWGALIAATGSFVYFLYRRRK